VDKTGSGSCSMSCFDIGVVERSMFTFCCRSVRLSFRDRLALFNKMCNFLLEPTATLFTYLYVCIGP
jgi:hypothetical protein